ncbi:MAG: hypothetical protein ACLSVD_02910 [Eggerthellaceae bacterium]
MANRQKHLFEDYDGFVEKFAEKTTDDCTPPGVYDCVSDWAQRFGIDRAASRPFCQEATTQSSTIGGLHCRQPAVLVRPKITILPGRGIGFPVRPADGAQRREDACARTTCSPINRDHNGAVVAPRSTSFGGNVAGQRRTLPRRGASGRRGRRRGAAPSTRIEPRRQPMLEAPSTACAGDRPEAA